MKGNWNLAALVSGALIFASVARAAGDGAASNPYHVISQHNVFGLIPPPSAEFNATAPPPAITLNGIMTVLGRKYALLQLQAGRGKSYLLGEGQSNGEIKLLSVDDRAGAINVSNNGVIQTIALAKSPALLSGPSSASMAGAGNDSPQASAEGVPLPAIENNPATAAAPVAETGYAGVRARNSQSGSTGDNPPATGASNSQNPGSSNPTPQATPEPWWAVASRNLEAARTATADLVTSGQAEPFPLTPYTPPGTPANLIGAGQLYFVGAAN